MVSSPCLSPIGAKLTSYYNSKSANGRMELVILSQPEEQHRARYLTEGSRGAIKDISGLGHPTVKLNGYYSRQPIKLECYIGHDKHNGLPHLFYQASKISGKNSTQCTACKVEGTSVIVMNLLPEQGMQATIDCVGILKERNVDVEQKLLNLNYPNKMLDFNEYTYQAPVTTASAFTSISTGAQQQHQATSLMQQHQQQPAHQILPPHLQQQQQQQQQQQSQPPPPHLLIQNHNHLSEVAKFEHSALIDENSISSMSRADSFDDSTDLSRHSFSGAASSGAGGCLATSNTLDSSPTHLKLTGLGKPPQTIFTSHHNGHSHTNSNGSFVTLNSRKRSVRCRLVFRVKIPETGEVLQTISTPIICTQPLGTPEICKKSITTAPAVGNTSLELFIIGKNFLKDSKIVFKDKKNDWLKVVEPDKEHLNSSHLVCKVPDYDGPDLANTNSPLIEVEFQVKSGGKFSDPHPFIYNNVITTDTCTTTTTTNNNNNATTTTTTSASSLTTNTLQETLVHVPQIKFETQPLPTQVHQLPIHQQAFQQSIESQQQHQFEQQQQQSVQDQQIQQQIVLQQQQVQQQQHQQQQLAMQQQIQSCQILGTSNLSDEASVVLQQQQHQQQLILQQQHQQTQLVLQQQSQQPQITNTQILTTIDLNDETTVVYTEAPSLDLNDESTIVYADTLPTQTNLVHSVMQNGAILSNMSQLQQQQQQEPTTINQANAIEQTIYDPNWAHPCY